MNSSPLEAALGRGGEVKRGMGCSPRGTSCSLHCHFHSRAELRSSSGTGPQVPCSFSAGPSRSPQ